MLLVLLFVLPQCTGSVGPSQEPHNLRETGGTERSLSEKDASNAEEPQATDEAFGPDEQNVCDGSACAERESRPEEAVREDKEHAAEKEEVIPEKKEPPTTGCFGPKPCYPFRFVFTHPIFVKGRLPHGVGDKSYGIRELYFHKDGILFTLISQTKSAEPQQSYQVYFVEWSGKVRFSYQFKYAGVWYAYLLVLEDSFLEFTTLVNEFSRVKTDRFEQRSLIDGRRLPVYEGSYNNKHSYLRAAYDRHKKQLLVPTGPRELTAYVVGQQQAKWKYSFNSDLACHISIDKNSNIYTCQESGHVISLSSEGKKRWLTHVQPRGIPRDENIFLYTANTLLFGLSGRIVFTGRYFASLLSTGTLDKSFAIDSYSSAQLSPKNEVWIRAPSYAAYSTKGDLLRKVSMGLFERVPVTILEDSSMLHFGPVNNTIAQLSSEGKVLRSFQYDSRRYSFPTHIKGYTIYTWDKKVYMNAWSHDDDGERSHVGIMEVNMPVPPLAKTGWPTLHGNFQNHRQQQ